MNSFQIIGIVFSTFCITSAFWFGFFSYYVESMKENEKEKVKRIFKNKK